MKNFDKSIHTDRSSSLQCSTQRINRIQFRDGRSGLAPLEMTLVLPILMLFMAAIIAFGYASMWKVRSEVVARDVVWRTRFPRDAHDHVQVPEWPAEGSQRIASGDAIRSFNDSEVVQSPIIVGQIPEVTVSDVLVFSRDVDVAETSISRRPPVLPRLGMINFDSFHEMLDSRFQVFEMGILNTMRRIPLIYQTDLDFILPSAEYQNALAKIDNPAHQRNLDPLERDPDFIRFTGSAPNCYPQIRSFTSTDVQWVYRNRIEDDLLGRIDRLPETIINKTIRLFERLGSQFAGTANLLKLYLLSLP